MKQLQHDTYDLCQSCYNALSPTEKEEFKQIEPPTVETSIPLSPHFDQEAEAARVAAEQAAKQAEEAEAARIAAEAEAARIAAEAEAELQAELARIAAAEEAKAE